MNPSCLKHTYIPGTSRLFTDYLYNFDHVKPYYDWDPFDDQSYSGAARQILYPQDRRAAMVQALAEQNPEAKAALKVLADNDSVAVVTGQQVGLFSGPAYTVYKAVTAVRLAHRLREQGLKAVPVFWLATEDHDLAEVDHAWVFNANGAPVKLQAEIKATGGPVGETILGDLPMGMLAEALKDFPYAGDVLAMVERSYRPGVRLGTAFQTLLKQILQNLGLLFLDPLAPAIRKIAAPFLAEAVDRNSALGQALRERSQELESAGYHAQVHIEPSSSFVFLLHEGRRLAFKLQDGRFVHKKLSFSASDLQAHAESLSPNALLRPVMQDFLLPTVAYVGGPAEVAYMAQAQVVYHNLLGRMPVIAPRNGFTLLDERADKLISRYKIQIQDLLNYDELARERIAQRLIPPTLEDRFGETRRVIEKQIEQLGSALLEFDPTLEGASRTSSTKMKYQLEKLARKVKRESLRRNQQASHDADYLIQTIYPHRHLQERLYTILPFLAQHGPELVGRLLSASRLDCPDHMVRSVAALPSLVYSN
jgi:bacillithiol synthase